MMRVLHVADAIDPSLGGGTAERTFQLARALRRADVDCTILCTDHGLGDRRRKELGDIDLVAVPTLLRRFLIPRITPDSVAGLVGTADIVHVTGHWSALGAMASLAARRLGKPYVYCPAGSLRIFGRSAALKRAYNRAWGQRIVSGADQCLAVTELEREQFHEYGVPDSRITLLPNGVQPDPALRMDPTAFRRAHALGDEKEIILFLGRLSPIKGPDLLMSAFTGLARRHPRAQMVFAGPDGELGNRLRETAASSGLSERIMFPGFLAGQDKQDALCAADLLVVPSRQEAMSLVALEAGLCGTPVVLTDQCGFDSVESIGGGLVTQANAAALADAIEKLLDAPEQRMIMGRRLRELVLADYTWDGICDRALELYARLIQEAGGRT